jgi:LmbE family N-acetylglucosaminyl deacetylase
MGIEQEINLPGALIVAHPDDETLWAGGYILSHPELNWVIITLCRGSDPDRAPKFQKVLQKLKATGKMGDLDDGPEQNPIPSQSIASTILDLLPDQAYSLIITHHPQGEYTRHLRHEETSQAVSLLWSQGSIRSRQLWTFAYEDNHRRVLPRVQPGVDLLQPLSDTIWKQKYEIITYLYGFSPDSWEARATPKVEGFWCFTDPLIFQSWALSRRSSP